MSENTKTELKLPSKYTRPSYAAFKAAGYTESTEEDYVKFFEGHEAMLAEKYASGEITEENFVSDTDEMTDADHDGLPDILHVRSQVRAPGNRTLRARQPTRHRFKQYLFADPSKRLVRKRPLRVSASAVRANLDELIEKEAAGILSVHAPNGARINLAALKAGQVVMAQLPPPAPLPNKPLDSAANDTPAGEAMPQFLGGTFAGDPIAAQTAATLASEKQEEADRKAPEATLELTAADTSGTTSVSDPVDPAGATEQVEQPPSAEVSAEAAPVVEEAVAPALATTEVAAPAPEEPAHKESSSSSSKKGGKKGGSK